MSLDLVAHQLPVTARRFRPAIESTIGQAHPVEVVHVLRIGPDSIAACRGLDDPTWFYEISTPLAIEVGSVGIVVNQGFYRKFSPRWLFRFPPEPSHD